jgi:hypothetical protein
MLVSDISVPEVGTSSCYMTAASCHPANQLYSRKIGISSHQQQTTLAQWSLRALRDAKPDDNPSSIPATVNFAKAFSK